jgi:hypothetical protein
MQPSTTFILGAVAAIIASISPASADSRKWVAVDDLRRYTCPSVKCGVVGRFFFRETLQIFEAADGWSRISNYKTAGCFDGKSLYVETGPSDCSAENGVANGKFAEWVKSKFLVSEPPIEPMKRGPEDIGEG